MWRNYLKIASNVPIYISYKKLQAVYSQGHKNVSSLNKFM